MNDPDAQARLVSVILVLGALLIGALWLVVVVWRKNQTLLQNQATVVKEATRRSVSQSRSTLKGQLAEQMAPHLPGFPYAPAEARFLGDPVDYVIFSGYSGLAENPDASLEIVLLEIKQGQSRLTAGQRAIGRALAEGRIRFEVCRVAEDGTTTTEEWRPD